MLKGYRTILINLLLIAAGPVLEYLGTVNWIDFVGETGAVLVMAIINVLMRLVTTTPVGKPA